MKSANPNNKPSDYYYDMPLTLSSLLVNSNIVIGPKLKEDNPSQFFLRPLKLHNISTYSNVDIPKIISCSSVYYFNSIDLIQIEIKNKNLSKGFEFNVGETYSELCSRNIFYLHFPEEKFLIPNLNLKITQIKNLSFSNTNLNKNLVNSLRNKLDFIQGLITISAHGRIICLEENKENILYQNIYGIWLDYKHISLSPKKIDLDNFIEKEKNNIFINCLKFIENTFYMKKVMPIINENKSSFLCVIFFKNMQCQYIINLQEIENQYFIMYDYKNNSYIKASEYFNINQEYIQKSTIENLSFGFENNTNENQENNQKSLIKKDDAEMSNSKISLLLDNNYDDIDEENNFLFAIPLKRDSLKDESTKSSNDFNENMQKWNNMVKENQSQIIQLNNKITDLEIKINDIFYLINQETEANIEDYEEEEEVEENEIEVKCEKNLNIVENKNHEIEKENKLEEKNKFKRSKNHHKNEGNSKEILNSTKNKDAKGIKSTTPTKHKYEKLLNTEIIVKSKTKEENKKEIKDYNNKVNESNINDIKESLASIIIPKIKEVNFNYDTIDDEIDIDDD